jgi:hypothetical protein
VISVSAVARGIAEADSVGIAANAQAATPISNSRFIFGDSPSEPRYRGEETMFREPMCSAFKSGDRNNHAGEALPSPAPAAAPTASPSAAASSNESHDEEQQYRTDGGIDDGADHAGAEMNA